MAISSKEVKMARRSRRIDDLSLSAPRTRGRLNEERVERALQELAREGEIHHYYRSEADGELDRQGIDFLVYPEPDWIIPLQVKSSFSGKENHFNEHGYHIPCVVVLDMDDPGALSQKVLEALGLSVYNLVIAVGE